MARLFRRLREVQGKAAAEEVVAELVAFLTPLNAEALKSLHEAGADLIALHSLEVPNTLHRNLLSTNAIENSFRNTRRKLGRVTRSLPSRNRSSDTLAGVRSDGGREGLPTDLGLRRPAKANRRVRTAKDWLNRRLETVEKCGPVSL